MSVAYFASVKLGCTRTSRTAALRFPVTVWYVETETVRKVGRRRVALALYVSERWCNPGLVSVKERFCTPDIELLTAGMRPYYLPREFTSTIVIAVYIPPSADAVVACDVISSAAAKLQNEHPDAFIVITGDFNHASLNNT